MNRNIRLLCKMLNFKPSKKTVQAVEYAYLKHMYQKREDGSEYILHPIRVANNVVRYERDYNEKHVIAALLHDTIEDTKTSYDDIQKNFGFGVADLVNELTNDDELKNKIGKTKYLTEKMLDMGDEALLIKLCDRLDNVIDLSRARETFQRKYVVETESIMKYLLDYKKLDEIDLNIIKDICFKLAEYDKSLHCMKYIKK